MPLVKLFHQLIKLKVKVQLRSNTMSAPLDKFILLLNSFVDRYYGILYFGMIILGIVFVVITTVGNFKSFRETYRDNRALGVIHGIKITWMGVERTPYFPPHAATYPIAPPTPKDTHFATTATRKSRRRKGGKITRIGGYTCWRRRRYKKETLS